MSYACGSSDHSMQSVMIMGTSANEAWETIFLDNAPLVDVVVV